MANPIRLLAPAKVNLALHIVGQRPDGYHLLDSLVTFADFGDWVEVRPAEALSLTVTGPLAEGVPSDADNLMWRAAEAVGAKVALTLEKHLPAQAGIGGGSSDAAAVLRALVSMGYKLPPGAAVRLGADVPVCMEAQAARMAGIGEKVTPVFVPPLHAILVNPGVEVPTGAVFAAMENKSNSPMMHLPRSDAWVEWLGLQRNDMAQAAIAQAPEIEEVLDVIAAFPKAKLARMSGSGATCFGLFETRAEADDAAAHVQSEHPNWWVRSTTLR